MNPFNRFVASSLIASTLLMGLPMQAQASMVSTEEALASPATARGVTGDAATARVQAMTDAEVAQLAGQMDQLPAGGDILGIMFTIFIILLITDILGLTKVFPFTRSVR
jgi:hypothetical protein